MSDHILPHRTFRWRWGIATLLLGCALIGVVRVRAMAQEPSPSAIGIHKVQGANWAPGSGEPLFIAVLGSDARSGPPNAGGGCDAIHIVAINHQQKAGTILNFPRDSFLEGSKITDTCRRAGFDGTVEVLKRHTGIPIHYLVRTEFSHFMALINEVGGVVVNVPYGMNDSASGAVFSAGERYMLGGDALAFSRNRKSTPNGDFSRSENQGTLLIALLHKFRAETTDPHRLFDYVRAGRRHVDANIPVVELIRLALVARDIDPALVRNQTIPGSTGSAGAASVVFVAPGDIYSRVRDDGVY